MCAYSNQVIQRNAAIEAMTPNNHLHANMHRKQDPSDHYMKYFLVQLLSGLLFDHRAFTQ
jgi:hypothetical protein